MVNHCSNPKCNKALHYLREGRIYVFDVIDPKPAASPNARFTHHMEHFWLCERCSETFFLEQSSEMGIRLLPKTKQVSPRVVTSAPLVLSADPASAS